MKFDLPCDESLFAARHPFMEPNFSASRRLTTYEAFQSLFSAQESPSSQRDRDEQGVKANPLNLNAMDMFILIHRVYPKSFYIIGCANTHSPLCLHPHPYYPIFPLPQPLPARVRYIVSFQLRTLVSRFQSRAYQISALSMAFLMDHCASPYHKPCVGEFGLFQKRS
jgi:hypothetical protein